MSTGSAEGAKRHYTFGNRDMQTPLAQRIARDLKQRREQDITKQAAAKKLLEDPTRGQLVFSLMDRRIPAVPTLEPQEPSEVQATAFELADEDDTVATIEFETPQLGLLEDPGISAENGARLRFGRRLLQALHFKGLQRPASTELPGPPVAA